MQHEEHLASKKSLIKPVTMKVLRKDYYVDNAAKVKVGGFPLKNVSEESYLNYSSKNTLPINKKAADGYSTFDDGLLFQFPMEKYKHLTYYCKTSTENLDTCNVKLFKLQELVADDEKSKDRKWQPPLS